MFGVAANVVLLPGTALSDGSIGATGSVVGGVFSEFSIIASNPARLIGKRGASNP